MQTFISETIDDILLKHSSFEDCVFVLPSQRAGVFVKDTFKNKTYDWAVIKQIGYNFELEEDVPETHEELLDKLMEELVSQRHRDNLALFKEWLEKRY